jgi:hypothetical protein
MRFVDIAVGTAFKYEGKEYIKTKDERISCCKLFNAVTNDPSKTKSFVVPAHEVEVLEK